MNQVLLREVAAAIRSPKVAVVARPSGLEQMLESAEGHGVSGLVGVSATALELPPSARAHFAEASRSAQATELAQRDELMRVLDAFGWAGIRALVFKGAALAYTHYAAPHLRPRVDTDLLIDARDREAADNLLNDLGYTRAVMVKRDAIFTQAMFSKPGIGHVRHVIDLHWALSNRPAFRAVLPFDELSAGAVPVAQLGHHATAPGPIHALLIACVHLVAHHPDDWRLIWLYDVSLIASSMQPADWARFRLLVTRRKVSIAARRVMQTASDSFDADGWLDRSGITQMRPADPADEPSSDYIDLSAEDNRRDLMLSIRDAPGLRSKARLVMSHAFPDAGYVRAAYGASGPVALTAAYVRRFGSACLTMARNVR